MSSAETTGTFAGINEQQFRGQPNGQPQQQVWQHNGSPQQQGGQPNGPPQQQVWQHNVHRSNRSGSLPGRRSSRCGITTCNRSNRAGSPTGRCSDRCGIYVWLPQQQNGQHSNQPQPQNGQYITLSQLPTERYSGPLQQQGGQQQFSNGQLVAAATKRGPSMTDANGQGPPSSAAKVGQAQGSSLGKRRRGDADGNSLFVACLLDEVENYITLTSQGKDWVTADDFKQLKESGTVEDMKAMFGGVTRKFRDLSAAQATSVGRLRQSLITSRAAMTTCLEDSVVLKEAARVGAAETGKQAARRSRNRGLHRGALMGDLRR